MNTKDCKLRKYCCLYVSDFHLEMILLPYIKNKINNSNLYLFSEVDLSESIVILLNKINFEEDLKKKILNLNWKNKDYKFNSLKKKNMEIIVNGSYDYIMKLKKKLSLKDIEIKSILECYDINKIDIKKLNIKTDFDLLINTNFDYK